MSTYLRSCTSISVIQIRYRGCRGVRFSIQTRLRSRRELSYNSRFRCWSNVCLAVWCKYIFKSNFNVRWPFIWPSDLILHDLCNKGFHCLKFNVAYWNHLFIWIPSCEGIFQHTEDQWFYSLFLHMPEIMPERAPRVFLHG
jgi:hypothetical protein